MSNAKKQKEDDVDILSIDSKIIKNFNGERKKLPNLLKLKNEITEILEKNDDLFRKTSSYEQDLQNELKEINEKINDIETNKRFNLYISETGQLVEEYKTILQKPIKVSFFGKQMPDTEESKKKKEIIEKYINIVQKYDSINLPKEKEEKQRIVCQGCKKSSKFDNIDGLLICVDCGSEQERSSITTSYKDSSRVNITTKYTYDRKVHFRECMNQYQGKQNCTIDPKVYTDLENEFRKHHLLVLDSNCEMKTVHELTLEEKKVRFSKIKKNHILMFLKELGYAKHYENVNLIHYMLSGIKPDDISHLEDKLFADFDTLIETYDRDFKNKVNRTSFISTQYVLYQLLQKHKHPCKRKDFITLKTVDIQTFHDDICQKIFTQLGWNHKPLY